MKSISKAAALLTAAVLLPGCAGTSRSLYEHGMDVVSDMALMSADEDYTEAMLGSMSEDITELFEVVKDGDYTTPEAVYSIGPFDEILDDLLDEADADLSEEMTGIVNTRLMGSVATQINASYGVSALAASSVIMGSGLFVTKEAADGVLYLYVFEDTYPVLVMFAQGEDGATAASGTFLFGDEFAEADGEELVELLSDMPILRHADFTELEIGR